MTKVSYIHGTPEQNRAPQKVAQRRFVNFGNMTDGELRLALISEQLRIQAEYYGLDEYNAAANRLESALKAGIGSTKLSPGAMPGKLAAAIDREIARARWMKRPAAGSFENRTTEGIHGPLIPLEDCDQYKIWDDSRDPRYEGQQVQYDTPESLACYSRNRSIRLLNNHLEGSAHHLLYEYLGNNVRNTVAAKRVLHQNAVSKLAEITELDRTNLRLWMRNGVMRANATAGTDPLQPEDTAELLRLSALEGSSVGALPALIAALPAILSALAGAVAATAALINGMQERKRQQMLLAAQGIGTSTFGPNQNDWPNGGGNGSGNEGGNDDDSNNDNLLPLLLAGGAFLMLK